VVELTAQSKKVCPACGGEAEWDPNQQGLRCRYCGTSVTFEVHEGEIRENDLTTALRAIPDEQRGWQAEKASVQCNHCSAISVFDPGTQGTRCPFCGSSKLVPFEENKQPFRPESLLPLRLSEHQVRDALKDWYRSQWFAPNNFSRLSTADTLKTVYLPFWTFDAQVSADWTAEAGFYYYVQKSYTDSQGKRGTRQRRETRWQWTSGHVDHFFDDVLVPASRGVPESLIDQVGPFPTDELVPYDSAFLAGHTVEHYQLDLTAAASASRERMEQSLRALCAKQVPGDTYRSLSVTSAYSDLTFKHILAPVWLVTYQYGATTYQVLANGVTGKIVGHRPYSWIKITLTALAAVIGVLLFLYIQNS
jgi:DNA-directed RNA polymerase subunit RPC12/RpoP